MTEELPHIRCVECGKVLANKWDKYLDYLSEGMRPEDALTKLGFTRYCCRMWMQSPFKIPTRSDRQVNPLDTGYAQQAPTLTMAVGPQPTLAPLQAMTGTQGMGGTEQTFTRQAPVGAVGGLPEFPAPGGNIAYTVVPLQPTTGITLPEIPEVDLPKLETLNLGTTQKPVSRVYEAW